MSRTETFNFKQTYFSRVCKKTINFLLLTKPRVVLMVLVATFVGFYIASLGILDWIRLFQTFVGVALAAGGTMALNQFMERDLDALMKRTQHRPLPTGQLVPGHALLFGLVLVVSGILYLLLEVNFLSSLITAAIVVGYLLLYTPLKKRTTLCTVIGSIPGALPPVIGWAAAHGTINSNTWVLFGILFFWQMPHLLAIAWLYRHDYERAGIRMPPVIHPNGQSTAQQTMIYCLALLILSLLPTPIKMAGYFYLITALSLGLVFLGCTISFAISRTNKSAYRLLLASYIYLPMLLGIMVLDKFR